jgi:elongation factor G
MGKRGEQIAHQHRHTTPPPPLPSPSRQVSVPHEFQGTAIGLLNKRKGQMTGSDSQDQAVAIQADVPLSQMFGFSTELRSATQGKGASASAAPTA